MGSGFKVSSHGQGPEGIFYVLRTGIHAGNMLNIAPTGNTYKEARSIVLIYFDDTHWALKTL
jgi:hypothetical protein